MLPLPLLRFPALAVRPVKSATALGALVDNGSSEDAVANARHWQNEAAAHQARLIVLRDRMEAIPVLMEREIEGVRARWLDALTAVVDEADELEGVRNAALEQAEVWAALAAEREANWRPFGIAT